MHLSKLVFTLVLLSSPVFADVPTQTCEINEDVRSIKPFFLRTGAIETYRLAAEQFVISDENCGCPFSAYSWVGFRNDHFGGRSIDEISIQELGQLRSALIADGIPDQLITHNQICRSALTDGGIN